MPLELIEWLRSELPYASLFWVLVAVMFELVRRCKSWSDDE